MRQSTKRHIITPGLVTQTGSWTLPEANLRLGTARGSQSKRLQATEASESSSPRPPEPVGRASQLVAHFSQPRMVAGADQAFPPETHTESLSCLRPWKWERQSPPKVLFPLSDAINTSSRNGMVFQIISWSPCPRPETRTFLVLMQVTRPKPIMKFLSKDMLRIRHQNHCKNVPGSKNMQ